MVFECDNQQKVIRLLRFVQTHFSLFGIKAHISFTTEEPPSTIDHNTLEEIR